MSKTVGDCAACSHAVILSLDDGRPPVCEGHDTCAYDTFLGEQLKAPEFKLKRREDSTFVLRDELSKLVPELLNKCDEKGRVALRLGAHLIAWIERPDAGKVAQAVLEPGVLSCPPVTGPGREPQKDALGRTTAKGLARVVLVIEVPYE